MSGKGGGGRGRRQHERKHDGRSTRSNPKGVVEGRDNPDKVPESQKEPEETGKQDDPEEVGKQDDPEEGSKQDDPEERSDQDESEEIDSDELEAQRGQQPDELEAQRDNPSTEVPQHNFEDAYGNATIGKLDGMRLQMFLDRLQTIADHDPFRSPNDVNRWASLNFVSESQRDVLLPEHVRNRSVGEFIRDWKEMFTQTSDNQREVDLHRQEIAYLMKHDHVIDNINAAESYLYSGAYNYVNRPRSDDDDPVDDPFDDPFDDPATHLGQQDDDIGGLGQRPRGPPHVPPAPPLKGAYPIPRAPAINPNPQHLSGIFARPDDILNQLENRKGHSAYRRGKRTLSSATPISMAQLQKINRRG